MVDEPLDVVDVRRLAVPALMMGFEPRGPLAGDLAGEELG